jgi:hypothetical protein
MADVDKSQSSWIQKENYMWEGQESDRKTSFKICAHQIGLVASNTSGESV